MIKRDIEIALKNFKRVTINIFVDNGTSIKRDENLVKWFRKEFKYVYDFENVEVLEFHMGYQANDKTYFVSKWVDLPSIFDIELTHFVGMANRSKEENLKFEKLFEKLRCPKLYSINNFQKINPDGSFCFECFLIYKIWDFNPYSYNPFSYLLPLLCS